MPKLLRDFLHEQQEPFALELYLLERGYSSAKASIFTRKPRNALSSYSNLFKSVINRLLPAKNNKKIESNSRYIHDQEVSREQHAYGEDDDEFSSADVFSAKEVDDNMRSKKRISMEYTIITKQLSPVSVLEETESDEEDSPLHHETKHFKTTTAKGESSTSTSQRFHDIAASNSTSRDHQYTVNKRILQESQMLLIDTVREVIELEKQRDKRHELKRRIMGPDELWKLVCEYLWLWSQDLIDESNVVQLLHYDFLGSQEDWKNDYEMHRQVVCEQVGDGILQEIILEVFRD